MRPRRPAFPTPSATIGPVFPAHYFGEGDNDLTFVRDRSRPARGQKIYIGGWLYEAKRVPRWNSILELWQADAGGHFAHPNDPRNANADPDFMGWGRRASEDDGYYDFVTVKPGGYRDPYTGKLRAPHINLAITGSGLMRRLATTLFFPQEDGNGGDPVLSCIPKSRQKLLVLKPQKLKRAPPGAVSYRLDLVLQGKDETPFFVD